MFDRPKSRQIHVNVVVNTNDSFPVDGKVQIKEQVNNYISTLEMGQAVRFSYMYKYIYDNVSGINFANVLIGTDEDNGNLQAKDIIIDPFEMPVYNPDIVEVAVDSG